MNIFYSLRVATAVDIYLSNDEKTKSGFPVVCKYFRDIKKAVDIYSKTHRFILDNYDILSESSSIKDLTVPAMFRWNAVLISEYHSSKRHRRLNSQLVNLLWQQNLTEILLEAPLDVQIPFSSKKITSQIKCWDSGEDFGEHLFSMMHGICEIAKAYVMNFDNDQLDFASFFRSYAQVKPAFCALAADPKLADFYSIRDVKMICLRGRVHKDLALKKKQLFELTLHLQQEADAILDYIHEQTQAHNDARDMSLTNAAVSTIRKKKIPLIVAGHNHIVSKITQVFSKTKGVSCVALIPKNKGDGINKTENKNDNLLQFYDAMDAETDFWRETTTLLRVINQDPENADAFYLANPHLFLALKAKIKNYCYDNDKIYLWGEMPFFIYSHTVLVMKKNLKDLEVNTSTDPYSKKRRIDVS